MLSIIKFRRFNRLISLISLITLVVLSVPVLLFIRKPPKTEATWFDDSYAYRQKISFTHNADITTDRRVSVTFATNSLISTKMQADCDDTRFTDQNGKLLRFKLVSGCNTASTQYDVVYPTIVNGQNISYVYYGNPSAGSASDALVNDVVSLSPSGGSPAVATEEQSPGPVAYWRFDEGTGNSTQDGSTNNNDGTITNAVWQTEDLCLSGKCLYFDGNGDYVAMLTSSAYNFDYNQDFTIQLWMRAPPIQTDTAFVDNDLVSKWDTGGTPYPFVIRINNQTNANPGLVYAARNDATHAPSVISRTRLDDNKFHFVSFVKSGSTLTLYVDGLAQQSKPDTTTTTTTNVDDINIGRRGTASNYFQGTIDDVKIFNFGRSAGQVNTDFSARGTIKGVAAQFGAPDTSFLNNGMVGYWKMDEASWNNNCSALSVLDSSGNANNGKSCPNTTGPTGGTTGKFGYAGNFDSTDDYVQVTTPASLNNLGSITISAWINPNSSGQNARARIIEHADAADTMGWGFRVIDSTVKNIEFFANFTTTMLNVVSTDNAFTTGQWQHVVVTWDGSTNAANVHIFVNGKEVSYSVQNNGVGTRNSDSSLDLYIGNNVQLTRTFDGKIDELRVYNRALSPSEIRQLANWAPGPVGWWKMDDNTGNSTTIDSSGFANTGTFTSFSGKVPWVSGIYGSAVNFDGVSGYVNTGNSTSLNNIPVMTVEAWIYPNGWGQNNFGGIVEKGGANDGTSARSFLSLGNAACCTRNLFVNYGFSVNKGLWWTPVDSIVLNRWQHVAMTFDNTSIANDPTIYINGVRQTIVENDTPNGTPYDDSGQTMKIGNKFGLDRTFQGTIDDVRVYNYIRTPKQVVEDMNAGHPAGGSPVSSQVIYWKFSEMSGNTINNNNPQQSSLTGTNSGAVWLDPRYCRLNGCLNFDTTTDNVAGGSPTFFDGATAMTWSVWLNPQSLAVDRAIISKHDASSNAFAIRTDATNSDEIRVQIANAAADTSQYFTTSQFDLAIGVWTHLAVVYDGSLGVSDRVKVFKNGRQIPGTITGTIPTSIRTSTAALRVGQAAATYSSLLSFIDEVKIYSGALTQTEVAIDANAGFASAMGGVLGTQDQEGYSATQYGPVGWWKLDENSGSTAVDSSNYRNTGNIVAAPPYVAGQYGTALDLDGSTQYVNVPHSGSLALTRDGTWEAWVNLDTVTATQNIMQKGSSNGWAFYINTSGRLVLVVAGGASPTNNTSLSTATWYHVAVVKSGATATFYLNGQFDGSGALAANITDDVISLRVGTDSTPSNFLNGRMDDVRLYNYALTNSEIAQDYSGSKPGAWLKFDDNSGTTTVDSSGNGNTGTLNNMAGSGWVSGKVGSALKFDGSASRVTVVDNTSMEPSHDGTWEAWIKLDRNNVTQNIIQKGNWAFFVASTGKLSMFITGGSNVNGNTVLSNGTWYHAAFVKSGTTGTIYLNGVSDASSAVPSTIAGDAQQVNIGSENTPTDFLKGIIDDVRVYTYARNQNQISYDYNRGAPIGWWKFDECQGSTISDWSLNGNGQTNGNSGTITIGTGGTQNKTGSCTGNATDAWKNGATGKYNASLNFDGTDDYANTALTFNLSNSNIMTVAFWLNPSSTANMNIIESSADYNDNLDAIKINYSGTACTAGQAELSISSGDASHLYYRSECVTQPGTNEWHHWAVVFDNGTTAGEIKIYIDNIERPTSIVINSKLASGYFGNYTWYFMSRGGASKFAAGKLDDVRVYTYELNATQMKRLYNEGFGQRFGPSQGSP